ncbi:MAG TPA: hypothetical protein VHE35_26370 [Kofleriaceae bacterium]|nr:hypothetical protein [Kofleriaceae bacterium]
MAGRRDQRGQAAEEGERIEDELGLGGAPAPAQAVRDLARGGPEQALVRERWTRAVAAEALEAGAIVGGDGGCRRAR